jgi:Argininosuccinate lyase
VFSSEPNDVAWRFGQSIESDMTLWREEIEVSIAHAKMLGETQIIPKKDSEKIVKGLKAIFGKLESRKSKYREIPRTFMRLLKVRF